MTNNAVAPLTAKERRQITQQVGAKVYSILNPKSSGTVEGHYDDDSVYVRWDGYHAVERWSTESLRVRTEPTR